MHKTLAVALAALTFSAGAALAGDRVAIGKLTCDVADGRGKIVSSNKAVDCVFRPKRGARQSYTGTVRRIGVDIGRTRDARMSWIVLATTRRAPEGALEGRYRGVGAQATVGVGVSANVLVGGFNGQFMLQPASAGTQRGLNAAGGLAGLTLDAQ